MPNLTDAIRQFDATEANLKRLEDLWVEISGLIPAGMSIDTGSPEAQQHADLCRTFEHIRKAMPKVDGYELTNELVDLDSIFMSRVEARELGEISVAISVERMVYAQGDVLQEYRFRFAAQRRALVRDALSSAIREVDTILATLGERDLEDRSSPVSGAEWDRLKELVAQVDVLRGSAIPTPKRWGDLHRHLHSGLNGDLYDIIEHDWPAAKPMLEEAMYGPYDPVPVETADLSTLVKAAPTGPVVTALKWEAIDDEAFERLIYNIVADAEGYSNPQWLTYTKAPDRGRDISVQKTVDDALSGKRVHRVIIQCKHWRTKGIGVAEVTTLVNQMKSWEPPKVDELVIATSGRFSADAVDWIERHNNSREVPLITMWPDSHLESLLSARPHLIGQFQLR